MCVCVCIYICSNYIRDDQTIVLNKHCFNFLFITMEIAYSFPEIMHHTSCNSTFGKDYIFHSKQYKKKNSAMMFWTTLQRSAYGKYSIRSSLWKYKALKIQCISFGLEQRRFYKKKTFLTNSLYSQKEFKQEMICGQQGNNKSRVLGTKRNITKRTSLIHRQPSAIYTFLIFATATLSSLKDFTSIPPPPTEAERGFGRYACVKFPFLQGTCT